MKETKHEDWIDVLREASASGRNDTLPEGMWERISASLDTAPPKPSGLRRLWVWSASIAAAAVVAGFGIFMMRTTVDYIPAGLQTPVVSVNTATGPAVDADTAEIEEPVQVDEVRETVPAGRHVAGIKQTVTEDMPDVVQQQTEYENPLRQDNTEEPASQNVKTEEEPSAKADKPGNGDKDKDKDKDRQRGNTLPLGGADWFPEQLSAKKRAGRKGMLALSTTGAASASNGSRADYGSAPMASADLVPNHEGLMVMDRETVIQSSRNYDQYSYHHRQPLTLAASFDYGLGHNLFVGAGVSYTRLSSKVTSHTSSKEFNQLLQYVGIPVTFKWAFVNTDYFMVYVGAEAQAEFLASAKFDGEKIKDRTTQLSAHAVVGAQVNLGKHIGIYVEPKLSHYFRDTKLKTVRNTDGVNFNLQLGLRFSY